MGNGVHHGSLAFARSRPRVPHNGSVLATAALVVSLAVADSINPVTVALAVYLASTPDPSRRLSSFALGVFSVYLVGGLVLVVGPGELLRSAAAGTHTRVFHLSSLAIGSAIICLAILLWVRRSELTRVRIPGWALKPRSSFVLGATVTAVDLLTAFPYFAAVGVIVSSKLALPGQLLLLVVFNVLYVLPLVGILIVQELFGARAEQLLARGRAVMERVAAPVLAALTLGAGIVLVIRAVSGLAAR